MRGAAWMTHPGLAERFEDENLLATAKLLFEMHSYYPPRAKVEAMEAALRVLAA
jgi:hypothetical protein